MIRITFGLDKCAKTTFKRGKLARITSQEIDRSTAIKDLDHEEFYKYLGINENPIKLNERKGKKECYRRIRAILKIELNSAKRIETIIKYLTLAST